MKLKSLIMIFFLLTGSLYLEAQKTDATPDQVAQQHDTTPGNKDCTDIVNVQRVCEADGTVTLTFYIANNSSFTATDIKIEDGNGFVFWIYPNTPPMTVSATQVTYPNATPGVEACFDIKLYNPQLPGGICCFETVCVKVEECPCATMGRNSISCIDGSDAFLYCFGVNNPAYSTDTFDEITLFSSTPNICVNGLPLTNTFPIAPIAPGTTGTVCLSIEGCSGPLTPGDLVNLQFFLESSTNQSLCCHDIEDVNITVPCCVVDDCSQFTFSRNQSSQAGNFHTETITSGVTATVSFRFDTYSVPDRVQVLLNGNPTPVDSGSWSSSGHSTCPQAAQGIFNGTINVVPCDVVTINVFGNTCNVGGTGWRLDVGCNGSTPPQPYPDTQAEAMQLEASNTGSHSSQRMGQINNSLQVFPNPVRETLNIRNSDADIRFEAINILDASGKIIRTDDMSENTEISVDVSSLPRGIYFIDAMDSSGNKVTERFVKIK